MNKIISLLLSGIGCCSCTGFLEPKSQSEFIPSDAEQLNELVISALPEPSDQRSSLSAGFLDLLTDDVEITGFLDPRAPTDIWYTYPYVYAIYAIYTWQPNYSAYMSVNGYADYAGIYSNTYRKLVYVNALFDYIDRVSGSETVKNYVKAQAHTLRAFYYLHLVNVYGAPYSNNPNGPGIPLRTTAARENRRMTRNTVKEVYDLVTSDLLQAIDLFDTLEPSYQYRRYRPTLPMALLLLSRACLYMENWTQAAVYAEKLIRDWPRFQIKDLNGLIANSCSNVHRDAATTTSPDVRRTQIFYKDFVSYDNTDVIWIYGSASDLTSLTGQDLALRNNSRTQNNRAYAAMTQASQSLVSSYDASDLRLRTYFVRNLFHEPDYDGNTFNPSNVKYRAYGKLLIADNGTGIPDIDNNRFKPQTDAYTFGYTLRITEAYLILAEAQAMLGGENRAKALQTLAAVWEKRFAAGTVPASYTSGSDMIELVRKERRRELCFEALRWFDLRRWGMNRMEHTWYELTYGDRQVFVLEKDDPGYTLPIPHTILEANPDLTQVPMVNGGGGRRPVYTGFPPARE